MKNDEHALAEERSAASGAGCPTDVAGSISSAEDSGKEEHERAFAKERSPDDMTERGLDDDGGPLEKDGGALWSDGSSIEDDGSPTKTSGGPVATSLHRQENDDRPLESDVRPSDVRGPPLADGGLALDVIEAPLADSRLLPRRRRTSDRERWARDPAILSATATVIPRASIRIFQAHGVSPRVSGRSSLA